MRERDGATSQYAEILGASSATEKVATAIGSSSSASVPVLPMFSVSYSLRTLLSSDPLGFKNMLVAITTNTKTTTNVTPKWDGKRI